VSTFPHASANATESTVVLSKTEIVVLGFGALVLTPILSLVFHDPAKRKD